MQKYYWFYICSRIKVHNLDKGTIVYTSLQDAVRNAKGRPLFFYRLPKTAEVKVVIQNKTLVYELVNPVSVIEL
jgi:hypothetical protein